MFKKINKSILITIILMALIMAACQGDIKDTPNDTDIKTEDFNASYDGVFRYQESVFVTIYIKSPYQKTFQIHPQKDFALKADGEEVELISVNDEAILETMQITGLTDSRLSLEYHLNNNPKELKFQIKDKNNTKQWNINPDYIKR